MYGVQKHLAVFTLVLAAWACAAEEGGPPVEAALSNLFKSSGTSEYTGRAGLRAARNLLRGVHRTPLSADGYHQFAKLRQEVFCRDAQPLYMSASGDHTLLDPTLNITMIKIHPMPVYITVYGREHDIISGALLDGHQWEAKDMAELLWAMKAPLPPNSEPTSSISPGLLVDVGANVGSYSFNIAAMGYEVISFEGMESNQRLMRNSLCASARPIMSRVTLHAFGLGASRGTCYLLAEGFNRGSGIPICGAHNESHAEVLNNNPAYKVQSAMDIERMDDVLQRDVKAMKIDVEGFEPMVLAGAARLLQEHTVWFIYVEYKRPLLESSLRDTPEKPIDFVMYLLRLGYKISQQSFRGPFMKKGEIEQLASVEKSPLYFVHHKFE